MKKIILLLTSFLYLTAEEVPPPQDASPLPDVSRISEAFGHLLGKNLDSMGVKLDLAKVIQGLRDAAEGKEAPMSDMECIRAITTVQESALKEVAEENLAKAEQFLTENEHAPGVQTLEKGKLQYRIIQQGKGDPVDENSTPLIRYKGKLLDGSVFSASQEDEVVHLDETIPGFRKILQGMQTNEKRIGWIHPSQGYKTHGPIPPDSLVIFEIEVIQANASHPEALDALSPNNSKEHKNPEVATPFEEIQAVR